MARVQEADCRTVRRTPAGGGFTSAAESPIFIEPFIFMKNTPSMAAIAKRADVAKSTVSMALRNDPRITAGQRKRIQKVAAQMGYQTNALVARLMAELRKSRKQKYLASLAVINVWKPPVEANLETSNTKSWLQGFEDRATQMGYSIDRFWLNEPDITPARLARILEARNIQGVIFFGVRDDDYLNNASAIWTRFPSVVIGAHLRMPPLSFVVNDHYYAAAQACRQLTAAGYRRIGIVLDRWLDNVVEHRYVAGFFATLEDTANAVPPLFFESAQPGENTPRSAHRKQFAAWVRKYRPDACLCVNAFLLEWLKDLGLSAPREIGFALLDLPEDLKGRVAGMDPRSRETAKKAIDVLVAQLHRGEFGIPEIQTGTMTENQWTPGDTIRRLRERPPKLRGKK
jgi:LacI family transcriptional regulator